MLSWVHYSKFRAKFKDFQNHFLPTYWPLCTVTTFLLHSEIWIMQDHKRSYKTTIGRSRPCKILFLNISFPLKQILVAKIFCSTCKSFWLCFHANNNINNKASFRTFDQSSRSKSVALWGKGPLFCSWHFPP